MDTWGHVQIVINIGTFNIIGESLKKNFQLPNLIPHQLIIVLMYDIYHMIFGIFMQEKTPSWA